MKAQELEAAFMGKAEIDDYVGEAFREDKAEKEKGDNRLKAILGEDECLVQNCQLKSNYAMAEGQIKDLRIKVRDLTAENERLRKTLEKDATQGDREQCLISAMKDKMVQVLKDEVRQYQADLAMKEEECRKFSAETEKYRSEKDQYASLLGSDKTLHEQYQQLRLIEERALKVRALADEDDERRRKAVALSDDAEMKYLKLLQQLDSANKEYNHKRDLVRQADMILKNGFRIEPPRKPWPVPWPMNKFVKHNGEPKA